MIPAHDEGHPHRIATSRALRAVGSPGARRRLAAALVLASAAGVRGGDFAVDVVADLPGSVTLTWNSAVGRSYAVETSTNLRDWKPLVEGWPTGGATGPRTSYVHSGVGDARRFYRVWTQGAPVPPGFALVPAGSFLMGDSLAEGESSETPVRQVTVDAFLIQTTETSKAQWDGVHGWALSRGYLFDTAGSGKAPDHPVQSIKWFDAVKWCNARSEKEGLVPCYYLDEAHTQPYRQDSVNLSAAQVKWDASGYRLPTEAEWERAARGGIQGARFPWGDLITHSLANYQSAMQISYDVSPTRGYHPLYGVGSLPFTAPVGSFPANGFGLHDMSGNVAEHCWDWYGNTYYSGGETLNPRGPAATSGEGRVIRGGAATEFANLNRVSFRFARFAFASSDDTGFRPVRRP